MVEVRNHTPHPVRIELSGGAALDLPPVAPAPRLVVTRTEAGVLGTPHGDIRLTRTESAGRVVDLPDPVDGQVLVVARAVAEACRDRSDLVFPDELVRDGAGRVVGCRALGVIGPARHAGVTAVTHITNG